ncbi:thioester reductase-like protein [Ruminiclostridium sufflavum DSM 19573]|uniref:Thioester reductase-like protein n=1 Tax=Ruminiclostridium sufflavum DSM 19573 TaxID=1121337 RepID=A0A318XN68_9FIRM|nr:thioester reductase domain-containing protein [Ruminiclostridium sufflavum]PYG87401.1 thioester reductase-like protein [Ruminiclostridium sufflavum DSM 19573]
MEVKFIERLKEYALNSPMQIALTFLNYAAGDRSELNVTYTELYNRARAVAVSLIEEGLKTGDRVVVLSNQTKENVFAILGTMLAGGVFTIIPSPDNESRKQRFKSVLESSGAKFILYDNLSEEPMKESGKGEIAAVKNINTAECNGNPNEWIQPEICGTSLLYLQYTSGSTSVPKGVMVTYGNMYYSLEYAKYCIKENMPEVLVFWAPIFHNMGLFTVFLDLYIGARCVIMPPDAFLENPLNWLKAVSDYKAELTMAPNSAFDFCTKYIDDAALASLDLSTLKFVINGSEPITHKTLNSFTQKFRKCGFELSMFCTGYGLAEATCVASGALHKVDFKNIDYDCKRKNKFVLCGDDSPSQMQIASMGRVIGNLKAVIVDPETGRELGDNEIGEIWLQGETVSGGYWNQKEQDTTFRGTIKNRKGFFLKTGDIGALYDGELYIIGRLKEVIIINGHNLYSQDIEKNLKEAVPALRLCSIISFSKTIGGKERVITCVELAAGARHDFKDLEGKINESFSCVFSFTPYDIVFVEERSLPRTDNGKIQIIKSGELYDTGLLKTVYSTKASELSGDSSRKILKPQNAYEERVMEIFTRLLEPEAEISTDDSFFTIGGDSLAVTQLASMIKSEFGTVIPMKYILENPTIHAISNCIQLEKENKSLEAYYTSKKTLAEECRLDQSIIPDLQGALQIGNPENVFLTGSTGFVGAHLIASLMDRTRAAVYCHVRSKNQEDAYKRIIDNAVYFNCWKEEYRERIVPVPGELTKPMLGMSEAAFDQLSRVIDTIYHNGAMLNFIYPYSYLRNINVAGTEECLRLACRNRAKVFNHISTFSVFDNPSHFRTVAYENDSLESDKGYFLGYTESKWVAEKLVRIAGERGLKACIYRPGEITGAVTSGIWKMNDMVSRFIAACIQMEAVPDISVKVHITPVDYIAASIVYLSMQKESIGNAFNLVNESVKTVREIGEYIRSFGFNVRIIPYEAWKQLLVEAGSENALKLLEPLFLEEKSEEESILRRYADLEAHYDTSNVLKGLGNSGISCAPVDEKLMFRYLDHFVSAGYIPAPKNMERSNGFKELAHIS